MNLEQIIDSFLEKNLIQLYILDFETFHLKIISIVKEIGEREVSGVKLNQVYSFDFLLDLFLFKYKKETEEQ